MAVLALLVIALIYGAFIIYKSSKGEGFLLKISSVQEEKYPKMEEHFQRIQDHLNELDLVYAEQKKFRTNHSMHEIPAIVEKLDRQQVDFARLETKVDKITDVQVMQGLVIERLKTLSERN